MMHLQYHHLLALAFGLAIGNLIARWPWLMVVANAICATGFGLMLYQTHV